MPNSTTKAATSGLTFPGTAGSPTSFERGDALCMLTSRGPWRESRITPAESPGRSRPGCSAWVSSWAGNSSPGDASAESGSVWSIGPVTMSGFPFGGISLRELLQRTWSKLVENEIRLRASAAAYYALKALVPLLAVLTGAVRPSRARHHGRVGRTVRDRRHDR